MSTMAVPPEPPHVLAVDDSIVDRAVISRLLRSSKNEKRPKKKKKSEQSD
nr:unnamed protein product [Digitaria exilis]